MGRIQTGYIYESSGAFFVRYYVTEIVDGKAVRVQRSRRLCEKSENSATTSCRRLTPNRPAGERLRRT
jgi:hypothetical protein